MIKERCMRMTAERCEDDSRMTEERREQDHVHSTQKYPSITRSDM